MRIVLFCHSLASCWNHGNAHFLRGIARELTIGGHEVRAFEPADGWSRRNLVTDHGPAAADSWRSCYPELSSESYGGMPDLEHALDGADLVLVHEWNPPELVAAIGRHRRRGGDYVLLFHDTHHRAVSDPGAIRSFALEDYDGVLAFGACLRERYLAAGWADRVWTWHEAADTTVFRPQPASGITADLVWIGNWGDGERAEELGHYLIEPVRRLGLRADVHGVRYPESALPSLADADISFRGWLPNHEVPAVFASHAVTVHVPRRPYVEALPGIPTIRVFEALACGIPLVCAPWQDSEGLFPEGAFLRVDGTEAMTRSLHAVLHDPDLRRGLITNGLTAIRDRHSCSHRVDELLSIFATIREPSWRDQRRYA
ncbi:MAG: glycosyltransferase [Geminicoccaceae bacterium]